MKYQNTQKAIFLRRPNRFIARVLIDGHEEIVHVKNTGRCREILVEGSTVIVEKSKNPERKTRYSLICVYKGNMLINIDSQVPNRVVYDALRAGNIDGFEGIRSVSREVTFGSSRFDLYYESETDRGFIEVKGVTLENRGLAMFPDAPTERGSKHVYEMIKAVEAGYSGCIFFLIQMKGVKLFKPHSIMDREFANALTAAKEKGVKIIAYDSIVTEDSIKIGQQIEVEI